MSTIGIRRPAINRAQPARAFRGRVPRELKNFLWAMLFMLPAVAIIVAFVYAPFARSIGLSFFIVDRNTFEPAHFYGLSYYARIFNVGETALGDDYLRSMLTTFKFVLLVVPASIAIVIALAVLSAKKLRGIRLFRTLFTTSVGISIASASVIWSLIFSPNVKLLQWFLDLFGIQATSVLTDASTALIAVAVVTIWTGLGFNYLFALAGVQAIPRELYESGEIDGATGWKATRHITLPMLGPTVLFLFITSTIACVQAFTQFKVLIDSVGPDQSTNVFVFAIFNSFWTENNYGFASAMSVVLFLLTLGFSLVQYRMERKVHYQ